MKIHIVEWKHVLGQIVSYQAIKCSDKTDNFMMANTFIPWDTMQNTIGSGVAKGGRGAVRAWRHFYGGGTIVYAASYKPVQAVLK